MDLLQTPVPSVQTGLSETLTHIFNGVDLNCLLFKNMRGRRGTRHVRQKLYHLTITWSTQLKYVSTVDGKIGHRAFTIYVHVRYTRCIQDVQRRSNRSQATNYEAVQQALTGIVNLRVNMNEQAFHLYDL